MPAPRLAVGSSVHRVPACADASRVAVTGAFVVALTIRNVAVVTPARASLASNRTFTFRATPVAPASGLVALTVGAVVSDRVVNTMLVFTSRTFAAFRIPAVLAGVVPYRLSR